MKCDVKREAMRISCVLLLGASTSACGASDGSPWEDTGAASESEPLSWISNGLWTTRKVNVCWESNANAFPNEKLWVQQALKGQRSWEAAGNVVLTGFGACTSSTQSGIHLNKSTSFFTQGLGPQGGLSRVFLDFDADLTNNLRCETLSRQDCIMTVAIHEVGHALGIAHEHTRAETPQWCIDWMSEKGFSVGSSGDATYGAWDGQSLMNYCNAPVHLSGIDRKGFQLMYGPADASPSRLRDANADGRADLVCFDTTNGSKWVDFADANGRYLSTDWSSLASGTSCAEPSKRVFRGEFHGPSTSDLLCHDFVNGPEAIDLGSSSTVYAGFTDRFPSPAGWCTHDTGRLFVGDFDASGLEDLLCHDVSTGYMWIDYNDGSGLLNGTDWERAAGWCWGRNGSLHIGKFNSDGRADLLCHDRTGGTLWIDHADTNGRFMGTDWVSQQGKCFSASQQVRIGDFNGDGRDDLLCHDVLSGGLQIDYADANGVFFTGSAFDWVGNNFCSHSSGRLYVGKIDQNTRDDLLCHDVSNGSKWVDYADTSGRFLGTDWSAGTGFCGHASGQLL
jgi:hypothetical protein